RQTKITLVDDEGAADRVEDSEERRNGRRPARKDRLVADRPDDQKAPGLARPRVTAETEIRQLVELIVEPGEQHVVGRNLFEHRREVGVAVDVSLDVRNERLV